MTVNIALGLQWGDEGKGKIIDYLTRSAQLVVRAAGGANAGHTIRVGDSKYVLHLVPSGIVHDRIRCLLGAGMVVDPAGLLTEIRDLEAAGVTSVWDRLGIAPAGQMILPWHRIVERVREARPEAIGTTLRGIGPCYETKASRFGLPLALLAHPEELLHRLERLHQDLAPIMAGSDDPVPPPREVMAGLMEAADRIVPRFTNVTHEIVQAHRAGGTVLLEGAQGALLDLTHGTYPYVTSSSTVTGGILSGSGVGPSLIEDTFGVVKGYTTRVGNGPFPTEIEGEAGATLARAGHEFGATTGRPRRCGWLDIVALRHTIHLTGTTGLALTKVDVLEAVDEVKVCTAYRLPDGSVTDVYPADPFLLQGVSPVYQSFPSWRSSQGLDDANLRRYVDFIARTTETPVRILSFGPDRSQTAEPPREAPFAQGAPQ